MPGRSGRWGRRVPTGPGPDLLLGHTVTGLEGLSQLSTYELVAQGATIVRRPDAGIEWDVLAGPEHNGFCVLAAR